MRQLDIKETLKSIKIVEEGSKTLDESVNRLVSKFDQIGNTWRDQEYDKAKTYIDSAKTVVGSYIKSTQEYLDEVTPRIQQLEKEYLEDGIGELGGLDLGTLGDLGEVYDNNQNEPKQSDGGVAEDPVKRLTKFVQSGLAGFKAGDGEVIVSPVYDNVGEFHNGLALVEKNGTFGLINETGEVVKTLYYDNVIYEQTALIVQTGTKYGLLDFNGVILLDIQYDGIENLGNGTFKADDTTHTVNPKE